MQAQQSPEQLASDQKVTADYSSVNVRPYTQEDHDEVLSLFLAAQKADKHMSDGAIISKASFDEWLTRGAIHTKGWVACCEENIVGYVELFKPEFMRALFPGGIGRHQYWVKALDGGNEADYVAVDRLVVHPDARHHHVAHTLMRTLRQTEDVRDGRAIVSTVDAGNEVMVALYEKLGGAQMHEFTVGEARTVTYLLS